MEIVKINGQWRVYTWADGFRPARKNLSFEEEVRRNPEAVINRLVNQGRRDEAEELIDRLFDY